MTEVAQIKTAEATAHHSGLYSALAAAQSEMGRALKDSKNPHFKSSYADLASVMDACIPALTRNGIAVIQPTGEDDLGRFVKTVLVFGETGETTECRVPLIVAKNDMQGYGSAVTYARRYGLMSMAGVAPDDDDGNAAAKSPPKAEASTISADQFQELRALIEKAGIDEAVVCNAEKVDMLETLPANKFGHVKSQLETTINKRAQSHD